jgi:hypothetical protein
LGELAASGAGKISYTYDLGACWRHEITLEGTLECESGRSYPVCAEFSGDSPEEYPPGEYGSGDSNDEPARPRRFSLADVNRKLAASVLRAAQPGMWVIAPRGTAMVNQDEEAMISQDEEWRRKGATLSDKTARAEFGLTQDEIDAAIRANELQYRLSSMHGNPWLRLLRREVEALVTARRGERYLRQRQARAELARVNLDLKRLRAQVAELEEQRSRLLADLNE